MRMFSALLLALVLALFSCGKDDEIVLGFAGQLTGPMSDLGVQGRNGAMLAVEGINSAGGVNGLALRLEVADDGASPESAVKADQKLLHHGAVAVIGHMTSSQTMAALPYMAEYGAVLVSPTTATPELTGRQDHFFRVIPDSARGADALARHALGNAVGSVALMGDAANAAYVDTYLSAFEKSFEAGGGVVKASLRFSSKAGPDWPDLAREAAAAGADALVLAASARDVAAFARASARSGARPAILCPNWPYTREILLAGGESVEGILFAANYTEENASEPFQTFKDRYERRFGWPPNFAAAYSYEAVLLLAEALRKNGGKRQGLEEALVSTGTIRGVFGEFSLDTSGDVQREIFIVTISGGHFRTAGKGDRPCVPAR